MSLCRGRRKDSHKSAFVKSSALRWIRVDLRFNDTPPRPDYFQRLIEDFLALPDVRSFVTEFSLRLEIPDDIVSPEMSNVNDDDGRRKRFRYRLQGVDTVVRVNVYANRAARECLTVVTFDHFHLTVRIFKGNVSLSDLKVILRRYK